MQNREMIQSLNKPAVAFFGFNRPDPTKVTFEEIRRYRPQQLLLVADGPRSTVLTDMPLCESVREIMRSVDWECDVRTNFSNENLGCRKRMSSGIDWVFSQVEEAIILEDDCVPCPDFFSFCSEMLACYRDHPKIMAIAGTNFQHGRWRGDGSYYFSRFPHIWGWASWRRAWKHYDVTMSSWPRVRQEKWLEWVLPQEEQHYWSNLFNQAYEGKVDTWDIQWLYAVWRHEGIGIIANANLVTNIGAGPDATHTKGEAGSLVMATGTLGALVHPKTVSIDSDADRFTFDVAFGGKEMRDKKLLNCVRRRMRRFIQKLLGFMGYKISRLEASSNRNASGVLNFGPYKISRR